MKLTLERMLVIAALTHHAEGNKIISVDPASAKAGDMVSPAGEDIGQSAVDALYLTNGATDLEVQIVEQTDQLLKFKVPAGIKPGRSGALAAEIGSSDAAHLLIQFRHGRISGIEFGGHTASSQYTSLLRLFFGVLRFLVMTYWRPIESYLLTVRAVPGGRS
jgi:hypothetical protein